MHFWVFRLGQQLFRVSVSDHGFGFRVQKNRIVGDGENACQLVGYNHDRGTQAFPDTRHSPGDRFQSGDSPGPAGSAGAWPVFLAGDPAAGRRKHIAHVQINQAIVVVVAKYRSGFG